VRILVSGSSGLIGTALVGHLTTAGHDVIRLVRRNAGSGEASWDPKKEEIDDAAVATSDAVVHLAGAGIGDRRWTPAYKQEILDSRVLGTRTITAAINRVSTPPKVFLSGSAIGFYGDGDDTAFDESAARGTGFLADVCAAWEHEAMQAAGATRVVLLRTGIVLSPAGGALAKQLPLFRLGLGGRFGSGKPWQSWISLDDEIRAIEHLLTADVSGPVNLTAPEPVRGSEFAKTLGAVLRRPSLLPVPAFGPRLLLGRELADALLFTGQRVLPGSLESSGFEFTHPTLETALRALLDRPNS
jgi:uncharacterized protein